MIEYKHIDIRDINQIVCVLKLDKSKCDYKKLIELINKISKYLKSEVLSYNFVEFPNENYTITGILSTSHIALSTYKNSECYLDIDIVWCSGVKLEKEDFEKIIKDTFGEGKIVFFKEIRREIQ